MERVLREGAFTGQTHVVTGAGQGIGRSVAGALAAHGASVALVDLDEGRLKEVQAEIAGTGAPEPVVAAANVTDEDAVKAAVATTLEATGQINGVVNVAGVTRDARIAKKSYEDFKLVLAVHLHGTFLFTREVAAQHWHPLFKENGNQPLDDGVNRFILNFSSVSARNGNIGQIDYTAAKGAIEAATRTTAREFSSYRARVNAIAPGPVNTPMLAEVGEAGIRAMGAATLVGRIAEPEDISNFICALADRRTSGYVTGQVFQVNGGMYLA
ncbi:MAG: SDR family oxidoreductase [Deltaproteobacteria bacterium]|nr:SDR family oxidoreductase [Deltaproteobacteria bacterium]MBW2371847.1 SDR family oxidoreductase [Deltaproteobacteria bacterium]